MYTLYDLLGARPQDDAKTLKKAFRKAAKATHPDVNPGDPDPSCASVKLSGPTTSSAMQKKGRLTVDSWILISDSPASSQTAPSCRIR
jgi:curved DNA-binding protein CbpA